MQRRNTQRKQGRDGSVILWLAVTLVFLIPMVGLVIDVGVAYAVKARLSGAVDAAALAGAQSFSFAQSLAAQKQRAQDTATAYFNANFPAGTMATSNANFSAVATTTLTSINVVMSGSLDAPLFFLRSLGFSTVRVSGSGTAQRRIANIMMVLDRSGSLQQSGSCMAMVSAAQTFTTYFATGQDALGAVVFGGSYDLSYPITINFNQNTSSSLSTKIGTITDCNDTTGTAQALWIAWKQIEALNQPGALNAIVLFTDGIPNGLTADWPIKKLATPARCTNGPCGTGGGQNTNYVGPQTYSMNAASNCSTNSTLRGNIALDDGIRGWKAPNINHDGGTIANGGSEAETYAVTQNPGNNNTSNCAFAAGNSAQSRQLIYKDIAYIPATDIYGNDTTGSAGATIGSVPNFSLPLSDPYYTATRLSAYGKNANQNAIDNASTNAVYAAANRIRSSNLNPVIYTIGFGAGNGITPGSDADVLLRAVANDPSSAFHNGSQQTGKYVFVANAGGLQNAFAQIATVLLRLSQ